MKRALLIALISLALLAGVATADPILLKSRTIEPTGDAVPWTALTAHVGRHVLLQLAETPNAVARDDLAARGVHLLRPIPLHAYIAYIEPRDWAAVKEASPFRLVSALDPVDKMHPRLAEGDVDDYLRNSEGVVLAIRFYPDIDDATRRNALDNAGAETIAEIETLDIVYARVAAPEDAYWLAEEDAVEYVTLPEPLFGLFNDKVRAVLQANAAHEEPYSVTGAGVPVLIYDGGIIKSTTDGDAAHPDLQGRFTVGQPGIPDMIGHAGHVACTVAGDGQVSGGTYAGMAPDAEIVSMDITAAALPNNFPFVQNSGDIESSYRKAINTYQVRTANNSIGANLGANQTVGAKCAWMGDYTVTATLIDDIIGGSLGRSLPIVWAAGNEVGSGCPGTFYTIPPPSPAKNTISIGATSSLDESIAPFSSRGPTDDGRLRPDVAAPGYENGLLGTRSCAYRFNTASYMDMSGTSMAAPAVTGAVALLTEMWDREVGGEGPDPALVKATIIHAAHDLGNAGPDYTFGYGGVRIPPALDIITDGRFLDGSVDQGDTFRATFKKSGKGEVKVTVVWIDRPGALQADRNLVNNLNLVVVGPSGNENLPWVLNPQAPAQPATRGVDNLNPVEQVLIANAASGEYTVEITGADVPDGPQAFYLVYSGLTYQPGGDDDDDADDDNGDDDDDDSIADDAADDDDDDDDDDDSGCGC